MKVTVAYFPFLNSYFLFSSFICFAYLKQFQDFHCLNLIVCPLICIFLPSIPFKCAVAVSLTFNTVISHLVNVCPFFLSVSLSWYLAFCFLWLYVVGGSVCVIERQRIMITVVVVVVFGCL